MSAEEDIRRLIAMCAQRIDDRDVEGYVALFAPEARLVTRSRAFVGHDAIRQCMAAGWAAAAPGSKTKHLVASSAIRINNDNATALTDVVAFQCLAEGGWQILLAGRYDDEFVLRGGEWRFADRRISVDAFLHSRFEGSAIQG
jgi:hypothetical protein